MSADIFFLNPLVYCESLTEKKVTATTISESEILISEMLLRLRYLPEVSEDVNSNFFQEGIRTLQ